jgi:hypothetical protein
MKTLMILLGILVSAIHPASSQAAPSYADWEVLKLRYLYIMSSAPQLEDLKIGRTWACHYRSAVWGSHMTMYSGSTYTFETIPGDSGHVANRGSLAPVLEFKRGSLEGAQSIHGHPTGFENIRVASDGRLIAEIRTRTCSIGECIGGTLIGTPSQESMFSYVLGYQVCSLE